MNLNNEYLYISFSKFHTLSFWCHHFNKMNASKIRFSTTTPPPPQKKLREILYFHFIPGGEVWPSSVEDAGLDDEISYFLAITR
jgi:hypothetical protein